MRRLSASLLVSLLLPITAAASFVPDVVELNERNELQIKLKRCLTNQDCPASSGMMCGPDSTCRCRGDFVSIGAGQCLPRTCHDDWQCSGYNNTECIDGRCLCVAGAEYNWRGECQLPEVGAAECFLDMMCPQNAACVQRQCRCQMGAVLQSDGASCTQMKCSADLDCIAWPSTVCHDARCKCRDGHYLDWTLQKCFPYGRIAPETRSSFLMQNIFAIVVVCNFFLWITIFILVMQYVRRRRTIIAAAHRAALCGSGDRLPRLPHDAPPPPPAYDYQNYRTQAQLAPPPYSIDDPAKPPEYSTIVTTIPVRSGAVHV